MSISNSQLDPKTLGMLVAFRGENLRYQRACVQFLKSFPIHTAFFFKKKCLAGIYESPQAMPYPGIHSRLIQLDFNPRSRRAQEWILERFKNRRHEYTSETAIFLPPAYRKVLPRLEKLGFRVDSVMQTGGVREALKKLVRSKNPPVQLDHLNLHLRPARRKDIDAIMRLFKTEFSRNPQYGWFCADPRFLRQMRRDLNSGLKVGRHHHFVIQNARQKIVGYFSGHPRKGSAGLSLVFDQSIQGKGVAKTAYRVLLESLAKRGVRRIRGGTSQKAVMGLGRLMGRKVSMYILRYHPAHFSRKYFGIPN